MSREEEILGLMDAILSSENYGDSFARARQLAEDLVNAGYGNVKSWVERFAKLSKAINELLGKEILK